MSSQSDGKRTPRCISCDRMGTILKPGTRVFGAACTTEMIVVKAPQQPAEIRIGGHPALQQAADRVAEPPAILEGHHGPTLLGKRYVDESGAFELLCTKAGEGAAALGDEIFQVKDAKPLPSSD
jgi:hypothetical protein